MCKDLKGGEIMAKYKVVIKEVSKCVVDVEADNFEKAKEIVEEQYWNNPDNFLLEPYETYFSISI